MGLISGAIDSALQGIGGAMLDAGNGMLQAGFGIWRGCSKITVAYAVKSPMRQRGAWAMVTGGIYNVSLAVAASLAVLYFVMGWLRESIDIRNTFTLENMFRFFIRYVITASLIVNSLAVVTAITECAGAAASVMSVSMEEKGIEDVFEEVRDALEEDEAGGGEWLSYGFLGIIGGLLGMMVIIVCGVSIVLSVLSRLFKMLLCIPFAPVAFAGFAGGHEFAQTGIAWLRTFIGYGLEAVVIILSINISFGMFSDASFFSVSGKGTNIDMILLICECCMPMVTACACVKGAELTVRRCLGLG